MEHRSLSHWPTSIKYTVLYVANHHIPIIEKQKKILGKLLGIRGGTTTWNFEIWSTSNSSIINDPIAKEHLMKNMTINTNTKQYKYKSEGKNIYGKW